MIQRVVTGSSRLRNQVPTGTPISAPNAITDVALRSACFHAFGISGKVGDEIDDQQQRRDQLRGDKAACQRHEDQRRAEAGKAARGSRDEGDRADGDRGMAADVGGDEAGEAHALFFWSMM